VDGIEVDELSRHRPAQDADGPLLFKLPHLRSFQGRRYLLRGLRLFRLHGKVCDPTWRNSIVKMDETEWSYIGVEIDWEPLMKHYHDSWSGSFLTIIFENRLNLEDFIIGERIAA
jgi:hypothetical protein